MPLGVGREGFFEIANDVPGKEGYNRLISQYRNRDWKQLDADAASFLESYEDSPLREAVTFLQVQTLFDRASGTDDHEIREAEKKLREALLLYPKSDFAPVMSATAASFWLRAGNFQRGLAMYEMALGQYPASPYRCTYLLGMGEANYLLRNFAGAEPFFNQVNNACEGARLKSAALLRLADMAYLQKKPHAVADYEKRLLIDSPFIERFYQPTLANLGEIRYQAGNFSEAEYFFKRYLKTERAKPDCAPYVTKRLADILWRNPAKRKTAIGGYLSVSELAPETDIGRFSRAHSLLIDPGLQAGAELQRRVRLVDEATEKIQDESLRSLLFVEKGLVLLQAGEPTAVAYLTSLKGKTPYAIEKGASGRFIRERILALAQEGVLTRDPRIPVEDVFAELNETWLKGTPESAQLRAAYEKIAVGQIAQFVEKAEWQKAIERIKQWQASPLWPGAELTSASREGVAAGFLRAVYQEGESGKVAALVETEKKALSAFFAPKYDIVFWLAALNLDTKRNGGGGLKWERQLASVAPSVGKSHATLFRLATASGLRRVGNFDGAAAALKGLSDPAWASAIWNEKLEIAQARNRTGEVLELRQEQLKAAKPEERDAILDKMRLAVVDGRYWKGAAVVLDSAKLYIQDRVKLAPYYLTAARCEFEQGRFKQAADAYETAFRLAPETSSAEARFRLGKSLAKLGKTEAARLEWEKAAGVNDEFWSPLARSEVLLLTP